MSKTGYQVCGLLTSLCAFTSVGGAIYIVRGASVVRKQLQNKSNKTNPVFITEHVLWMSVCDIVQQFWWAITLLPVGFDGHWNANWHPAVCGIVAMVAQFFLLASASWNFVIAISLLRMLNATPLHKFQKEIKYNHMFVWITAFISCIIPWFGGAYGYTKNIELKYGLSEFECWIGIPTYALVLYLPAMIYVSFAAILLLFTYVKTKAKRIQHSSTSWRLALYTIVFVVTWTFPIILRVHGMTAGTEPHPFMVWMHHILIGCIGLGNAAIWGTSQSFKGKEGSRQGSSKKGSSKTGTSKQIDSEVGSATDPTSNPNPEDAEEDGIGRVITIDSADNIEIQSVSADPQ